jgi:AraC-like DNA-binding protein
LEAANTSHELADLVREDLNALAAFMFQESESPSGYLIERAVSILDRNYAKDISDAALATQLGLSTSHFRYLFKQTTGQPFHKYLMALRLEKAKRLLQEDDLSVSSVARSVGFSGLAHFSRAFAQRFSINPTSIRALRTKGPGTSD